MICLLVGLVIVKKVVEFLFLMILYFIMLKKMLEFVVNSVFFMVWLIFVCWEIRVVVMGFCYCGVLLFFMIFMVSFVLLFV